MPITAELTNLKKFEAVGFSHEQAETMAEVIEESHHASQEDLKEFFRKELKVGLSEMKADLLIKFFGIIVGSLTIAIALIKFL